MTYASKEDVPSKVSIFLLISYACIPFVLLPKTLFWPGNMEMEKKKSY